MKDLEKMLMGKKEHSKMSKNSIKTKEQVLQELMDKCAEHMGNKVKSGMGEMQKVTVAAPDKESLAKGLEKAKSLAESMPDEDEQYEDPAEEKLESPKEEMMEDLEEENESPKEKAKEQILESMLHHDDEDDDSMFAKKRK